MKVTGIIAEYNPFHKGHLLHLTQGKALCKGDYTIVVMSGDFVQRGTPAILDKYTRAEMALRCGADLVLELPVRYATASAEYFATGGVSLLESLGVVTDLCFGSELGDALPLQKIAHVLAIEPDAYKDALRESLANGTSYPAARAEALGKYLSEKSIDKIASIEKSTSTIASNNRITDNIANHKTDADKTTAAEHASMDKSTASLTFRQDALTNILMSPNNILGLEYCKALEQLHSSITPATLLRQDSSYHQEDLSAEFSSATSLRKILESGNTAPLKEHMPREAYSLLECSLATDGVVTLEDFALLLKYQLLQETTQTLAAYADLTPALASRILRTLDEYSNYEDYIQKLKTRDTTYTRIARSLLHVLLRIEDYSLSPTASENTPYAHVLGFCRSAAPLLKAIKDNTAIPLITKKAHSRKLLNEKGQAMLAEDIYAANLYRTVLSHKHKISFTNEITRSPIILS